MSWIRDGAGLWREARAGGHLRCFDAAVPRVLHEQGRGAAMPTGHVFVIKGAIGKVVADAAVVSTDSVFKVEPHWHEVVAPERTFVAGRHQPEGWSETGWGRDAIGTTTWFLDVTATRTGDLDAFGRLGLLLANIAAANLTSRVKGRPLPLVVLPVIGTKGGGFSRERGSIVDQLLRACREFVAKNPIDVAIVAKSPASYAALQHTRRGQAASYFGEVDLEAAGQIGESARDGSLALFIGAGTSIPAGAPSWEGLIEVLAKEADLGEDVRAGFAGLSPLDQAELLHSRLGPKLGETIKTQVEGLTPAMSHVLLANLNCQGAVTTNYDRLYEDAVASSDDFAATVLPTEVPRAGGRWLLKMHGDVMDPESIVLTRGQFVGFTGISGPAGAVLQSLLLTKHLLVVGTSMKDDNFLRLIYEVAAYRKRTKSAAHTPPAAQEDPDRFGTILSLEEDPARRELNAPHFRWKSMPGAGIPESARQLEIFLDAVAMYASGDNSWLLDPSFAFLLDEPERRLAERATALAKEIRRVRGDGAWGALAAGLDHFGANSSRD